MGSNLVRGFFYVKLVTFVAIIAGTALTASASRFGTMCQEEYQNGWIQQLYWTWERCSMFNNELDDTDTKAFYYNLHGGKPYWENTSDQNALDTVDLLYASTHGGAWASYSVWTMWDENKRAVSSMMRLGDESIGLSILSTYACETLKYSDGKLWTRMGPIFRGGLRIATGSYDLLYDFESTDEVGEDYADDLQAGYSIKSAWRYSNSDWLINNKLAVMATGVNATDCNNRLDGMTWQNFRSYPRLKDAQAVTHCYRAYVG